MKKLLKNFEFGIILILFLILFLPGVFSQSYIESRIDPLFLADEEINFNIRIHNPTQELFDGRLSVEIQGDNFNEEMFKDKFYLYPGDLYLKSLDERLEKGDYKIKIEVKDRIFETVFDQKILRFKVVNSCDVKNICGYEGALAKCEICRPRTDPFDVFIPVFFGVIIFGIILLIYFDAKRRSYLD